MNLTFCPPLVALVTGMEHSCTTYLSQIITLHPRVNAGFECGLLLADQPARFSDIRPFYDWMIGAPDGQWRISPEDMQEVCRATSWLEAYRRIVRYSPLFSGQVDLLVDKTPAYIRQLTAVMEKVPGVPVVVATKHILLQYHSYKKRGWELDNFAALYVQAQQSLQEAQRKYCGRILVVSHGELVRKRWDQLRRICHFVGLNVPHRRRFKSRLAHSNRHYFTRPTGHPPYRYAEQLSRAEANIDPAERRVLETLPDMAVCDEKRAA